MKFGIDFGTTNSACSGILNGRRILRFGDEDEAPFPSIVMIDKLTGTVYTGREAWARRLEMSESCEVFTSIKSILSSDQQWKIAGEMWSAERVAAEVFKGLKARVQTQSNETLREAVVAVPVGFSAVKRKSLRRASEMAGLRIHSFISESTAAVLNNYKEIEPFNKLAVFDWGGGTLDVSILENREGKIRELATESLVLGGDNIDRRLAMWVHHKLIRKTGQEFAFDEMPPSMRDKLLFRCELSKRILSDDDNVSIRLNRYGEYGTVQETITIEEFSDLIADIVQQAMDCMDKAVKRAHLTMEDLGCVLMVGGSVNLRPFLERAELEWPCHKIFPQRAEWAVAEGAAWLMESSGEHFLAEDVGVVLSNGEFYPIAKSGDVIQGKPHTATFALIEEADTANLIFATRSGEIIGYSNVPTFGFFKETIEVAVEIDEDMVLQVSSKSRNRSEMFRRLWSYPKPKLFYKLPVQTGAKS